MRNCISSLRPRFRGPPDLTFGVAVLVASLGGSMRVAAQQSDPAPGAYRAPAIVLARPDSGTGVPASRPVVVLRVHPGEADDPIDPATLRVWVDGADRSALFQMSGNDVWGPLGAVAASAVAAPLDSSAGRPPRGGSGASIVAGVHLLGVQLCSVRGVCGSLHAAVLVLPPDEPAPRPAVAALVPMALAPLAAGDSMPARHHHSLARRLVGAIASGVKDLLGQLVRRPAHAPKDLPTQD